MVVRDGGDLIGIGLRVSVSVSVRVTLRARARARVRVTWLARLAGAWSPALHIMLTTLPATRDPGPVAEDAGDWWSETPLNFGSSSVTL